MAVTATSGLYGLLLHAAARAESRIESKLSAVGLSLPKLAALHQLVTADDTLALGILAERLSCVKSNVTQLVDRLEIDGLVSRAPDPNDRRSRLAVITDAGRRSHTQGMMIQQEAERELFGVLTPAEAAQLAQIIGKIDRRPP
jgi:DNA-binding MarR family transcriptional regulator